MSLYGDAILVRKQSYILLFPNFTKTLFLLLGWPNHVIFISGP